MQKESPRGTKPARVLIAHQSTIPTYRVRFYQLLKEACPPTWQFQTVVNKSDALINYPFGVFRAKTWIIKFGKSFITYQAFLSHSRRSDVIILDTLISNITYLCCALLRPRHQTLIYWGHVGDLNTAHPGWVYQQKEKWKICLFRKANHFLVYTEEEKVRALSAGISQDKITVLNNTIDINWHRSQFNHLWPERDQLRHDLGFTPESRIFLILGRLVAGRSLNLILDAFARLDANSDWRLVIIGDGPLFYQVSQSVESNPQRSRISLLGKVTNCDTLAQYYTSADYLIMPGPVGLAVLEALSYDLPVLYFDTGTHGPEANYLTRDNSTILPDKLNASTLAEKIEQWAQSDAASRRNSCRFNSIRHLTVEQMAITYATAVTKIVNQISVCPEK